jgi:hypothetical protein
LQRVLQQRFPDYKITNLRTSIDLERSFGPIYARGLLCQGQSAFAVLGVNAQETQASICGAHCRHFVARFVPSVGGGTNRGAGIEALSACRNVGFNRERMARLHREAVPSGIYTNSTSAKTALKR